MKSFLVMFFLSAVAQAACPNLAGHFLSETEENYIDVVVTQDACKKITIVYDQGFGFKVTNVHTLDGKKRLVEDNGDFQAYETATTNENELLIDEERKVTDEDGETSTYFVSKKIFLTTAGDLVILRETMRADRVVVDTDKTTLKRQ
jgi:hypothetical protein